MNKTVKIGLGIFVTLLIMMLSGSFENLVTTNFDFIPFGLTSQVVILIFSGIFIYFFSKKKYLDFNFGKITAKQLVVPIVLVFCLSIVTKFIFMNLPEDVNNEHFLSSMSRLQIFFMAILLAPLSEELLFRGFLQNMLAPLKSISIQLFKIKLTLPVLISGILFGLIHFSLLATGSSFNFTLVTVIAALIIGLAAGYFQEKHHAFLIAVIIHMTANISGMILDLIIT
jgi:membrane protease YdiL (CAAX protease family)